MNFTLKYILILFLAAALSSCINNDFSRPPQTKAEEEILLKNYLEKLESQGHDIDTTALGVYYVTIDKGIGDFPLNGDTLEVGYAGYLIDGTLFDASDMYQENQTFEFVLGETPMIKGWDDGMRVINKNAKVQLVIPSELAFGSEGAGIIKPNQTLIFVVEMIEIKTS